MGREEQIEEREVLESIFPNEIAGKLVLSQRNLAELTFSCSRCLGHLLPRIDSIRRAWTGRRIRATYVDRLSNPQTPDPHANVPGIDRN